MMPNLFFHDEGIGVNKSWCQSGSQVCDDAWLDLKIGNQRLWCLNLFTLGVIGIGALTNSRLGDICYGALTDFRLGDIGYGA